MEITPMYDRVVIRPIQPEEVTAGGIIIPDSAKVGDKVVFTKNGGYSSVPIQINISYGEELLIIKESEIVAILN